MLRRAAHVQTVALSAQKKEAPRASFRYEQSSGRLAAPRYRGHAGQAERHERISRGLGNRRDRVGDAATRCADDHRKAVHPGGEHRDRADAGEVVVPRPGAEITVVQPRERGGVRGQHQVFCVGQTSADVASRVEHDDARDRRGEGRGGEIGHRQEDPTPVTGQTRQIERGLGCRQRINAATERNDHPVNGGQQRPAAMFSIAFCMNYLSSWLAPLLPKP